MTTAASSALFSDLRAKAAVGNDVPSFVDGRFIETAQKIDVRSPYDGALLWSACTAAADDVQHAIACAERGLSVMSQLPAHRRATILRGAVDLLQHRREQFAARITLECGKPIRLARAEVDRCVQTFSFAADEARRIGGGVHPHGRPTRGRGPHGFYHARAPRDRWRDHALQFPAEPRGAQAGARHRSRECSGAEALTGHAGNGGSAPGIAARGRPPAASRPTGARRS